LAPTALIAALVLPASGAAAQSAPCTSFACNLPPIGFPPPVPAGQQLLVNSGFEDEAVASPFTFAAQIQQHGWERAGGLVIGTGHANGICPGPNVFDPYVRPHCWSKALATGGNWGSAFSHASFGYQQVTIPANAAAPVLSFYLLVDSQAPLYQSTPFGPIPIWYGDPDRLTVSVRSSTVDYSPSQNVLAQLARYTLYDAPAPGFTNVNTGLTFRNSGWLRKGDFDLSAYKGQTIQVWFDSWATMAPPTGTNFYVDDVQLLTSAASGLQLANPVC